MMNKKTLLIALLIAILTLTPLTALSWHHPSTTDDLYYEQSGPRPSQVLMKIYGSYPAEYLAFKAQEIDLMDWPLAAADYAELEALDPDHDIYNSVGYPDFGVWQIDINNQQYPTDVLSVRKALSHMIDKRFFINTFIGSTVAVKADSPTEHLAGWYNHYCDDLYNLVTRTTVVPFPDDLADFVAAYNYLVADLGEPVPDPEGGPYFTWLWPAKPEDPHGYVNLPNHLLVFARSDDPNRANLGAFIKSTLEVDMPAALLNAGLLPARIHVDLYTVVKAQCKQEVMCEYRYHLYTGGWGLTRDPDNLAFCYASYQCWKPICYSPNNPCYNNPLFDAAWDNAESQPTAALAVPYVYQCQQIIMDDAAIIPVWLTAGYKAYLSEWDGVVNMAGRGPHNFFTLMNAHLRSGTGYGDTLLYGFVNDVASLNPVHASGTSDLYVMENIYDTLIRYNPYDVAEDIPWMSTGWWMGTWDEGTKTKLTFHMRDDMLWQDVPPKADRKYGILPLGATNVPVTTKDVAFTVISIRDNPDGWNQFLVADVAKVEINDAVLGGAQMLRSYDNAPMDVYGLSSVPTQDVIIYYNFMSPWLSLHWIGGLPILPYHIWYWVPWWDYDGDEIIDTWLFDPEFEKAMQGCGPWIFDYRIPGIEILLRAWDFYFGWPLKPPVALFTYSPQNPVMDELVTFNASASYDPDGSIVWYEWDFGDNKTSTGKIAVHGFSKYGYYTVTLKVTDNDGLTDTTYDIVHVVREIKLAIHNVTDSGVSQQNLTNWLNEVNQVYYCSFKFSVTVDQQNKYDNKKNAPNKINIWLMKECLPLEGHSADSKYVSRQDGSEINMTIGNGANVKAKPNSLAHELWHYFGGPGNHRIPGTNPPQPYPVDHIGHADNEYDEHGVIHSCHRNGSNFPPEDQKKARESDGAKKFDATKDGHGKDLYDSFGDVGLEAIDLRFAEAWAEYESTWTLHIGLSVASFFNCSCELGFLIESDSNMSTGEPIEGIDYYLGFNPAYNLTIFNRYDSGWTPIDPTGITYNFTYCSFDADFPPTISGIGFSLPLTILDRKAGNVIRIRAMTKNDTLVDQAPDTGFMTILVVVTIPGDCAGEDPMAPPWSDGKVFWQDLVVVLVGYGATPEDPKWTNYNLPRADFNSDNQIFWQDLLEVLVNYGNNYENP